MPAPNNTLATATYLNVNAPLSPLSEQVSAAAGNDYYRVQLSGRSSVQVTLNGLSDNANLELLNGTGSVVSQSGNGGTLADTLNQADLAAGTYYIRVFTAATSANYTLNLQAQSDTEPTLVWRDYASGANRIWQMDGTTQINNTATQTVPSLSWRIDGVGDFNSDGIADLVWRNYSTSENVLWLMNIADQVSSVITLPTVPSLNWQMQGTGDFTNDGYTDILWRNYSTGDNVVWQMNGTTRVDILTLPNVPSPNWQMQGTGDFNQDGKADILWRNYSTGDNVVWTMNGTTRVDILTLPNVPDLNWQIGGVGDFNKDGKVDILWRHYGIGDTVIWMMNGITRTSVVDLPATEVTSWRIEGVGNRYLTPPGQDEAGNTTATAFNVGTLNANGAYAGVISPQDLTDYYRFTLAQVSVVGVRLEGLSADLAVRLLDLTTNQTWGNPQTGSTAEQLQQPLNPGTYYVKVEGAMSAVNSGYRLKLFFNAAPPAPSSLALSPSTDTGRSATDQITNATTLTLTGQAGAGFGVTVLSGGQTVGQTTTNASGAWTLTLDEFSEGDYTFTATATDLNGFVSPASATLAVGIDTSTPQLILDTPTTVLLTQQSRLSGFVDGTGSEIASLLYQFGNLPPVSLVVDAYGEFDQALNYAGVISGAQTLTLTATDLAGNVATSQFNVSVNQDIIAPTLSAALEQAPGVVDTDGVTANPVVSGTLTGGSAGAQLWAGFDLVANPSFTNVTTAINPDGSFTLDAALLATINGGMLPDEVHTLHLQARDAAGNLLSFSDVTFSLDRVNPQLTITSALETNPLGNGAHITGTVNETGSNVVTLQYQFDNLAPLPLALSAGSFYELIDFTGIANGAHTLTISSTDLAGNVTTTQFNVIVQVDVTAQSSFLTLALANDTGTNATDGITSNPTIAGSVTGAQVAKVLASLEHSPTAVFWDITSALGTDGSLTLDAAQLAAIYGDTPPDGAYTLRLQAVNTQATVIGVSHIAFTLDSTAPDLNVASLIDGIAWLNGQESLAGTLTDFDPGTTVAYYFDDISGSTAPVTFDSLGAFSSQLTLPEGFGSHTLNVIATDQAGNQQDLKYTFLIKPLQVAVDDETLDTTGGNNGGNSGNNGNAYQWSSASGSGGGGSIWGYGEGVVLYGSGMGQESDPLGALGANAPYEIPDSGGGYGHEFPPTYLEKLGIILDNAVASINADTHLNRKAVLKHRAALLMEIGDMTQQGGFYNRMAPALYGIYDLANNHPITTRGAATAEGGTLAGQLISDTDAVKVEVYNAELLAAVNSAFVVQQYNFTAADQIEYRQMADALIELSRTYAALNPTAPDDKATSTTPDFLDSLWRAQKTVNNEPLSITDIRAEMQRGVRAISDLLEGVENPLRAIQFVNNLIQAATNVESLKDDIRDAKFLRELVEFGFEVAKVNPQITIGDQAGIKEWLEILWEGNGNKQLAAGGVAKFLDQPGNSQDRLERLDYSTQLVKAVKLVDDPEVKLIAQSSAHLSYLLDLGSSYAALNPSVSDINPSEVSFLTLVAQRNLENAASALEQQISKALIGLRSKYNGISVVNLTSDGKVYVGDGGVPMRSGSKERVGWNLTNDDRNDDLYPIVYRIQREDGSIENPVPGDTEFTLYNERKNIPGRYELYPGDKLTYATDDSNLLGQNKFRDLTNANYKATEKVFDALRFAPLIAGPQLAEFAADIAQLVKEQPILTGLAVGAFVGIQLSPLALPLNVGLILLGGWQAGFSLGSFFYKAANAQSQTQLFDAARDFNTAVASLVGSVTSGSLLKLDLSGRFQNVKSLFGAGLAIWREFRALEAVEQTPSFARGISIVIDKFKNAETAVGRLLQYGDEGVKAFLNTSSANAEKLTIEGLSDFASRFKKVSEVAAKLDENADVAAFLLNNRNLVKFVLDGGRQTVDDLANLLRRPGMTDLDLKELLGIQDINPKILRELLDDEGLTISEIRTGFGGVCFVAGTKVLTPKGEQAIESLVVGESVLASNPESDVIKACSILRTFEREAPTVLDIQVGNETITCTPEHPFWIVGKGWQAARQLQIGTPLLTHDGETHSIESIQCREGLFKVYNIEVEELHTYYVSSLQILVHNECALNVVKRSGMPENIATDLNGNPVIVDGKSIKVYGQAFNSSSDTPGHGEAMMKLIAEKAPTGEYEYFTVQRSWRTATGRVGGSGLIPDVIGVRRNGQVDAWEVYSNTQNNPGGIAELNRKLQAGRNSLPLVNRGIVQVVPPAP